MKMMGLYMLPSTACNLGCHRRAQTRLYSSDKGKNRANESVSGNISGSTARAASASGGPSTHRQMLGGMALESRYTSNSSGTLDEPLSATLVRLSSQARCSVSMVL